METKTLDDLKVAAVKRLPNIISAYRNPTANITTIFWYNIDPRFVEAVKETEWLNIVHLLEEKMDDGELNEYVFQWNSLREYIFSSYKKRLQAMHNSGFLKD